jgi:hypothetical protein
MSDSQAWLEIIERQVRGVKFGSVQIARRSAKIRFDKT